MESLLTAPELAALLKVADRWTEIDEEEQALADTLHDLHRRHPRLVRLHSPYRPEERAGIVLHAMATPRGRELAHAYEIGLNQPNSHGIQKSNPQKTRQT